MSVRTGVILAIVSTMACGRTAWAHPHAAMDDTTFVRARPAPGAGPLLWSLGGTVIPQVAGLALLNSSRENGVPAGLAILVAGISAGPALGYYAGGRGGRATLGVALRAGMLVTALALANAGHGPELDDPLRDLPGTLVTGYGLAALSATFDVALLRSRLAEPDLPLLDVIPGRLPSTGAASLALRVRF